jgi:hypothetical protein
VSQSRPEYGRPRVCRPVETLAVREYGPRAPAALLFGGRGRGRGRNEIRWWERPCKSLAGG